MRTPDNYFPPIDEVDRLNSLSTALHDVWGARANLRVAHMRSDEDTLDRAIVEIYTAVLDHIEERIKQAAVLGWGGSAMVQIERDAYEHAARCDALRREIVEKVNIVELSQ